MKPDLGPWIRVVMTEGFFVRLGPISVELPIRVERLLSIQGHDADIPVEMLASELVAYLEERPSEYEPYRLVLAELAMSVGTEAGKAGDNVRAALWLGRSVAARGDDPYCLANYAAALVRSGRPREALEVCDRIRRLPMPRGIGSALLALQRECAGAIAEGSGEPVS